MLDPNEPPVPEASPPRPEGKICPYPFSRMELRFDKFIPCCWDWLKPEYLAMDHGRDAWNGPAARELRRRMLREDYSFCRRDLCHVALKTPEELEANPNASSETPISPENLAALKEGQTVMPEGPAAVCVISDPRCNLACPSCRDRHIVTVSSRIEKELEATSAYLAAHRNSIGVIKVAGNGEAFFSPWLREILRNLSRANFPRLDHVYVLTNGLLLDEKTLEELRPGSDSIRRIMISIDAGTEKVYQLVRGGSWPKLMRNLEWVAAKRREGRFDWIVWAFVVRAANFRTIPEFVALGHALGVDRIRFSAFYQWPGMGIQDYEGEAVHLPGHPWHEDFRKIYEDCRNDPMVFFSMAAPGVPSD